jgi:membrane-associated phospholipid phosphatase
VFGFAVGLARVALGVHFPLDIAGAGVIGGFVATLIVRGLAGPTDRLWRISETVRKRALITIGRGRTIAGDNARSAG